MAEKLTKAEWEQVQESRKAKTLPDGIPEPESEPEEPEVIEIEDVAYEENEEKKYETCEGCGCKKLEKGMKYCPDCGGALDWS